MVDVDSDEKINLILMNGVTYVWTSDDWLKIRKLRILGNFIGNLAALPRQDQIAGLPLALLKEETTLLLEKGFATVKVVPSISKPPDADIREKSTLYRNKLLSEQSEILKSKRQQEIESKIDIILEGKKLKRQCMPDGEGTSEEIDKKAVLEEEIKKIQPPKKSSLAVQIFTADPWIKESDHEDCIWDYPRDIEEQYHYLIFKDLWERGYYITPGGKFGGDYLAYGGDPINFHAFFIIICLEKEKKIDGKDIITYGRLGQSVKKTVILAYLTDDDNVCYQSIQWAGF